MKTLLRWFSFFIVLGSLQAPAAPLCRQLFLEAGKNVDIALNLNRALPTEINLTAMTYEARGDANKVSQEVIDVLYMMTKTKKPVISSKEINEKGKLELGLSIGNDFWLELKYESNDVNDKRFTLRHIQLRTPSGKPLDLSINPIDAYDPAKLVEAVINREIGTYPDGYTIHAKIPTLIAGDVAQEIRAIVKKLELVDKDVVRKLVQESNMTGLIKKANWASRFAELKKYISMRLVAKQLGHVIAWPIKATAGLLFVWAVSHSTGITPQLIQEKMFPKDNVAWVSKSLQESVKSASVPAEVKKQLLMLKEDLANQVDDVAFDQNAPKTQVTKEDYLWTTTVTDKETGKSTTLVFISSDNKRGTVNYTAIQVDPVRYQSLVAFIRNAGQFIPISNEDLKP